MPDRKDLDRPAIVILAVSGLVFMAVSIPFLPGLYCKSPAHNPDLCEGVPAVPVPFDVAWARSAVGAEQSAAVANAPADASATVHVEAVLTGDVHITMAAGDCQDTYDPNLRQSAAQMTWTLKWNDQDVQPAATFTCADGAIDVVIPRHAMPALGSVKALNGTAAAEMVADDTADQRETGDFSLTLHSERQASPIPSLPAGDLDPTLSVTMRVAVDGWDASVTRVTAEAGK